MGGGDGWKRFEWEADLADNSDLLCELSLQAACWVMDSSSLLGDGLKQPVGCWTQAACWVMDSSSLLGDGLKQPVG